MNSRERFVCVVWRGVFFVLSVTKKRNRKTIVTVAKKWKLIYACWIKWAKTKNWCKNLQVSGVNNYKRKAMRGSSGVDYSAKNFKLSVFLVNF